MLVFIGILVYSLDLGFFFDLFVFYVFLLLGVVGDSYVVMYIGFVFIFVRVYLSFSLSFFYFIGLLIIYFYDGCGRFFRVEVVFVFNFRI